MKNTLHFNVCINAPREKVWRAIVDPEGFKAWNTAFAKGSYFEGSWEKGAKIRFLTPAGEGMTSMIVEIRPLEFISIKHLGIVKDGVDDTKSPASKVWAPAFEIYTLREDGGVTAFQVDVDVPPEYEDFMAHTWPKALDLLKRICEK